jgi:S-DNA-T family DNA segregation ATPase FtsK/SpoIIIE
MQPDAHPSLARRLARWAWHYRTELAPAWVALGVLTARLIVRPAFYTGARATLITLTLASAATAGGLWRWGGKLGLDRPAERVYAAAVTMTVGLWLDLAILRGPLATPVLWAWAIGTLAAAVPWWRHRRWRAMVRVIRAVKTWASDAEVAGLGGSTLQRVDVDPRGGWAARLLLRPGQTIADALPKVRALESALGLRPRAIEVDEDPHLARRVILRVQPQDPHATASRYPGPPPDASITRPCRIGRYQDGTPTELVLANQRVLIAGASGSGKSNIVNIVVWYLAACPDVVLWGCDLKFGLELGPWRPVFARVATTPDDATDLLHMALRVIQARGGLMEREGLREWPISPERPALVILIDEHKALADHSPTAVRAVETQAAQGRAAGVGLVLATQYPTVDAMGSSLIAPQCGARVGLRLNSTNETNVVFGPGSVRAGWLAHQIPRAMRGGLYLQAPEAETPRLARSDHVTDQMVAAAARTLGPGRPTLDEASMLGATEVPAPADGTLAEGDARGALLAALGVAGPQGAKVAALAEVTSHQKTWVYERLQEFLQAGQVERAGHGRWRLIQGVDDHDAH